MARRGGADQGLARQLHLALRKSGVTQKEVARRLGVHVNTLNAWVNGRREIGGPDLMRFAEVTGTPMEVLSPPPTRQGIVTEIAGHLMGGADAAQAVEKAGGHLTPRQRQEFRGATDAFREAFLDLAKKAWGELSHEEQVELFQTVTELAFRRRPSL